jgi:hypothetical protein
MRRLPFALAALTVVAAASCTRGPLQMGGRDAGRDVSGPSTADAAPGDVFDAARADAPIAPGRDALADAATDGLGNATGDSATDAAPDAAPVICPAGEAPLDVCGCGCCGGVAIQAACYYPALGQTRAAIPNPTPSPQECALNGCVEGRHYVCCADPGVQRNSAVVCARDTSLQSRRRFTITRRDADVCTTLEIGSTLPRLEISAPTGYANVEARRGPCDGSSAVENAIGGLGRVTPSPSGMVPPRYDVHVVLFFDDGTSVAEPLRIDADEVAVAPLCTGSDCPVCGLSCTFDATYRFTTVGGLAAFRDMTVLAPPASFAYNRRAEALPTPDQSCAPALPACGGASIDVADLMTAFSDADVQTAFTRSTTATAVPFFGEDQRGGDGPAFQVVRDGGGIFLVGAPCPATPTSSRQCTPIPSGVSRLISVLTALNRQQLAADPSCAFVQP